MSNTQIIRLLDGDAWIEYGSHWYEYIGEQDGKHIFSDIVDGYAIFVSDKALRQSTEFYFTEKF